MPKKKQKFKTIFDPCSAFGGHECHVTSDGNIFHVKYKKAENTSYKIVARLTLKEWINFVKKTDLLNPYNKNPATLVKYFVCDMGEIKETVI
jgi:hypothetical protein